MKMHTTCLLLVYYLITTLVYFRWGQKSWPYPVSIYQRAAIPNRGECRQIQ